MKLSGILLGVLILVSGPAPTAAASVDLVALQMDATLILMAGPTPVRAGPDNVRNAYLLVRRQPGQVAGERVYYTRILVEFDCRRRAMRYLRSSNHGRGGNELNAFTQAEAWTVVAPRSTGGLMVAHACASEARQAQVSALRLVRGVDPIVLARSAEREWPTTPDMLRQRFPGRP